MEHSDNFLNWIKESNGFISPKIAINDYSEAEGSRLGIIAIEDISVYSNFVEAYFFIFGLYRRMKSYLLSRGSVSFLDLHQSIEI
jgi:hypothetical protein